MKRRVSSRSYSGLFLMPRRLSAGERLFVSLNTPPSRTGTYSKLTPVSLSISGITRWLRYALGLPKSKWNSTLAMTSPCLSERTDFQLKGPRVVRLLIKLPIGLGDRDGPHQTAGIETVQRRFAFTFFDPLAHPRGIDSGVDDQMGDMNIPRAEFPRSALGDCAQTELRARECSVAGAAAQAGSGAGEEDASVTARQHQSGGLPASQKTGVAGHFPDLAKHAFSSLEQGKIHVGADIEDADLERRVLIGVAQESRDLIFLARIERPREDVPTARLYLRDQRCQLLPVAASREDGKAFGGKSLRDRGTDVISGSDDRSGSIPRFHRRFSLCPTRCIKFIWLRAGSALLRKAKGFGSGRGSPGNGGRTRGPGNMEYPFCRGFEDSI